MKSLESSRRNALVVALVALPFLTAQSCPSLPAVRILTPKEGLNVTYEPLYLVADTTSWSKLDTFTVWLNGVDITDQFTLTPSGPRVVATAVDVWNEVLPGQNELVVATNLDTVVRTFSTEGDPYADDVTQFVPGPGYGFGSADLPGIVTGPPQGLGLFQGGLDVLSLGQGGSVVLEFVDNVVVDYPGVDFTVFENPFLLLVSGTTTGVFAEPGLVSVSQNGVDWYTFDACHTAPLEPPYFPGCAGVFPTLSDPQDPATPHPSIPTTDTAIEDLIGLTSAQIVTPNGAGGDSFDLADVGLTWARYVRIDDVGSPLGQDGTVGFDLDAVAAVNSAPPTDADLDGIPDAAE